MRNLSLAVFLSLGESFTSLKNSGQDILMLEQNIIPYAKKFDHVWVYSYNKEKVYLPANCRLLSPPFAISRYLYPLILPLVHHQYINKTDIIRCFQLSGAIPALMIKIIFGKKFVFNFGYNYVEFAKIEGKWMQALLFRIFQPLITRMADGVIVKAKTLLPIVSSAHTKVIYLPNGVDIKKFKPIHTQKLTIPLALCVGRLEPQKNFSSVIRAISRLTSPVKLIVIGQGSQRQLLLRLARRLDIKLEIISKITHNHLAPFYQQATLFISPSIKEGSPKALLEAMSCGLPCIASNIPEHREIITHNQNGLLINPTNSSLSTALASLLRDASMQKKLGGHARNTIVQRFNHSQLIKEEIRFLQNL